MPSLGFYLRSMPRPLSGVSKLLIIITLTISGCRNPEVVWSTESKSSDGKMVVTAKAFANEGGGSGGAPGTFVYLNWATGSQKPREVLELSEDVVGVNAQSIVCNWVSPQHLELDYQSDKQEIQFQAVRFAGIEISLKATAASPQPSAR